MSRFDIALLAGYLASVLVLGYLCRRGRGGRSEYFLAGRRMGVLPVGLSLMVTSFSAINYMAIPEEVAGHGLYVAFCFPVFFLVVYPISRYWVPFFHKRQCVTVYEFLSLKYSERVRKLASVVFLSWRGIWMAIALYASGKILAAFTDSSPLLMAFVCGAVAIAYTCMGGIKAVMWTDVLQFVVIVASILLGCVFAWQSSGGADGMSWLTSTGNLKPFMPFEAGAFSLDPRIRITFVSAVLGTLTAFMTRYGADQVVMQRYFTARDEGTIRRGLWLNAFASFFSLSLLAVLGIAIYAHAVNSGALSQNSPMPQGFALKHLVALSRDFPAGLAGLMVAGMLASTMSSVDSGINACAASLVTDFRILPRVRTITVCLGGIVTALAVFVMPLLNEYQSIFAIINRLVNALGSPLLVMVMLGMFSRRMSERGIFYGGILGVVLSVCLTVAVSPLALHYYAVVNALVTWLACWICHVICLKNETELMNQNKEN